MFPVGLGVGSLLHKSDAEGGKNPIRSAVTRVPARGFCRKGVEMKPAVKVPIEVVFLDTQQLASRWSCNVETIRRKLRRRELASVLIGRRRLVGMTDVLGAEAAGRVEKCNK